jgi:ABC-type transporter Mla MlaB component
MMMLKITKTQESASNVALKLEGKVTEQWATLLDDVCRIYLEQKKTVHLDCANVDFIDADGIAVLRNFPPKEVTLVNTPGFVMQLLQIGERSWTHTQSHL